MADEELKQLMRENLEVSQESLKILKKINRARIMSGIYTFLKWVFIILASIGAYYYIEPYINIALDTLEKLKSGIEGVSNMR